MKHSISLPYRVTYVSDESQNHKAQNIVDKNPQTVWRTSRPFEEARLEATFTSIHITNIEITTSCCPQIEIEVYNKSQFGEELDNMRYLEKNDIISQESFLENTTISRVRNIKPFDEEYMKDKYFTCIRVYLYNPYHDVQPVCLGLNSMIIYGIPESPANIKGANINRLNEKSTNILQRGDTIAIDDSQPEGQESLINAYGKKNDLKKTHKNRYYNNDSEENSRNFAETNQGFGDLGDLLGNDFQETKRVKHNVEKSDPEPIHISPDEFETAHIYEKYLQQSKERSLEARNKQQQQGYYKDNTNTRNVSRGSADDDEFKRAIQLSKESYARENQGQMNIESIEGVRLLQGNKDEVTAFEYNQLLDKYDDNKQDDVSLEEEYNQASNRIDDVRDDLTEPLESELGDDELLEGLENEQMEDAIFKKDQPSAQTSHREPREEFKYEQKDNSNKGQNKYWDHKNYGHGYNYGGQEMFKLEARELSDEYLRAENQARRGNSEKAPEIKVATSLGDVLKDVVFSLSGFGNPERQILKDNAIEMGARFKDDLFDGMTTHLICREKNNGKYEMARKFKNKIWIVRKDWVDTCYLRKKRLDERYYEIK